VYKEAESLLNIRAGIFQNMSAVIKDERVLVLIGYYYE
jgi:hypothetical protein